MKKLYAPGYNLGSTILGGQSFSWEFDYSDDCYYGALSKYVLKLKQEGDSILYEVFSNIDLVESEIEKEVKHYLRLDFDYDEMLRKVSKDRFVEEGISKFNGIRILRQDFLEAFFGFIASQNRSIKLIRQSMKLLREKYGEPIQVNGKVIHLFPKVPDLALADLKDLLDCKMGYRAKFIKEAAIYLIESGLADKIEELNVEEAREELLKVNGIGEKVADCILMCGLGHEDVFPLDVWGNRIVHDLYGLDPKLKYTEKREWLNNYFEGMSAWAGQFLFENIRGFKEEDYR